MIFAGTMTICRQTAERIAAAAEEHGYSTSRHAALSIEAAARLFAANRATSAVPATVDERSAPVVTVHIALQSRWLAVLADASLEHGLTLEAQLRAVLDASVRDYKIPAKVVALPESPPAKRPKAVPRHRPFDPAYYAQHSAAFK